MVNMPAVDQFLIHIQTKNYPNEQLYTTYRDFSMLRCIYRAHQGGMLNPLTRELELENM